MLVEAQVHFPGGFFNILFFHGFNTGISTVSAASWEISVRTRFDSLVQVYIFVLFICFLCLIPHYNERHTAEMSL